MPRRTAVGTIPVNPETVVEVVSNTIKPDDERSDSSGCVSFFTLEELEKSMQKHIKSIDISEMVQESISRMRGRA